MKNNRVNSFQAIYEKNFDSALNLAEEQKLLPFFKKLDIGHPNSDFLTASAKLISSFLKSDKDQYKKFLMGKITVTTFCQNFIQYIFSNNLSELALKSNVLSSVGKNMADEAHKHTIEILSDLDFPAEINLLGYGSDDGHYETEIANFLKTSSLTKSFKVLGFDPYSTSSQIPMLSIADIQSKSLSIDLIIARWSLHHIQVSNRWDDIISCLNSLSTTGKAIFIEHGLIDKNLPQEQQLVLQFLNAFLDAIGNINLRPEWLTSTAPNYGQNFFAQYLSINDLEHMKKECHHELNYQVIECGPAFPWQSIILFERA